MSFLKAYLTRLKRVNEARDITATDFPNNKVAVDTNILNVISGTFAQSGLTKELKNTTMTITDVATEIPATPLTDRNAIAIFNKHASQTLYIGNSDVTADTVDGKTSGWEIDPNSYIQLDIRDTITLYAVFPTGESGKVKIMEVA
jgi:hypothetical protein